MPAALVFVVVAAGLAGVAVASATQTSHAASQGVVALGQARPPIVNALPAPTVTAVAPEARICDLPTVGEALAQGDDEGAVTAAGGGGALRDAMASGRADCFDLSDPASVWFVVNKRRPFPEPGWVPNDLVAPEGIRVLDGSHLDRTAAAALQRLVDAAAEAGVGTMAVASGYRSYGVQVENHANQVATEGQAADQSSARAGFSEHQTGYTVDLVACDGDSCGGLDAFGSTAQGRWVAENGWRHGWIVRYESGAEAVTGYTPEPWHIRYVGADLARAYHDGGFHTLEEFFGLPAAPDYAG